MTAHRSDRADAGRAAVAAYTMDTMAVAALCAELKAEAIALRSAGDKVGALAKVREMRALRGDDPLGEEAP